MYGAVPIWLIILIFPLLYAHTGCAAVLIMVGLKWLLMGRYEPCEKPLWSAFVWKTEVVTSLLDNFTTPYFLGLLTGTPYINWFFRLLGTKVGKRVYLDCTGMTEFDLVELGDDVAVNLDCTLQTHLFEDRVMKMSHVRVDSRASLGAMSVILYDTHIGEGANVGDLSLVMKGESLPAATAWIGIPGQRSQNEHVGSSLLQSVHRAG
jgi:non-ribosomal peptide synthetase-like protein